MKVKPGYTTNNIMNDLAEIEVIASSTAWGN